MKIFIVILHYGDIGITKLCIQSLYKHEKTPFALIVVNNAEKVYKATSFSSKKIIVINNKKNLGFAGGVNRGIQYALGKKADIICLLNNDTSIKKPLLGALVSELISKKQIGIVAPAIEFTKDGMIVYDMGGKVNTFFLKTSHKEVFKIQNKKPKAADYVSGCCMLIKAEVFKKIGLFDESFFLYYEDVDFCLRAQKKGFQIEVVPSVAIYHQLSTSVGKMSQLAIYHLIRSSIIFGRKYATNSVQQVAHRLFVLFQSTLFLKANLPAAATIAKALLE